MEGGGEQDPIESKHYSILSPARSVFIPEQASKACLHRCLIPMKTQATKNAAQQFDKCQLSYLLGLIS